MERPYCKKTGEILVNPKFNVGTNCPIRFAEAMEEDENKGVEVFGGSTSDLPF